MCVCVCDDMCVLLYTIYVVVCIHAHNMQTLCMTTGNGILYSAGTDLYIRSWHLDSLEEIGCTQVHRVKGVAAT